jgi:hypothetical protein
MTDVGTAEQGRTLSLRVPPRDDWDVTVNMCIMVDKYLDAFRQNDGFLPRSLDNVFHALSWHYGLNVIRWIDENHGLVEKYARFDELSADEQVLLKYEYQTSIKILTDY